jgi:hypothetical protein
MMAKQEKISIILYGKITKQSYKKKLKKAIGNGKS